MNPLEWSAYNQVMAGFATTLLLIITLAALLHYAPRVTHTLKRRKRKTPKR